MEADQFAHNDDQGYEPPSYWQETTPSLALTDELPSTCEVAVVGGGMIGSALGYQLARAGVKTVLLERRRLAQEATGRNGGFVSLGLTEPYPAACARLGDETARAVLTLTRENQVLLRHVLVEEQIACDYREPGSISLALNDPQLTVLEQAVTMLRTEGVVAHLLDREQMREHIKTPLGQTILGGLLRPENGVVHPVRLVQGLVAAAQRYGLQSCAATVQQIIPQHGGVIVQTTRGTLRAATVIVAVNAWTGELVPQLAPLITPVRGQMLAYAPPPPVFSTSLSASWTPTGEYWQQRDDGTIVLGGCRAAAPDREVGMHPNQPTPEVQTALEQIVPHLFPALQGLQVVKRWAGMMAFTPDYLPIVDHIPDRPDLIVVGGFCGHGMPFGLRLGQLLAEAVTSHTWPDALLPLRLSRGTLLAQ